MKKQFLFLLLLLLSSSGIMANQTDLISGFTLPDIPSGTLNLSSQTDFTPDANGWIVFSPKVDISGKGYWTSSATNGNSRSWTIPSGSTAPFKGGSSKSVYALQKARCHALRFTGAEKLSCFLQGNSSSKKAHAALYSYDGEDQTEVDSKEVAKTDTYNGAEVLFDGLNSATDYIVYFYGDETSNSDLLEVALKASTTPTLTGAWKISSTDVTGTTANVVQGGAATMPTFIVGATSGTPTTSNYNVLYSKTGDDGIFTYTDGVPTGISTANAGSATITATLTTKDASKYLTPATNTFQYTVSVSAASAPTKPAITGDASVARGGELTLTTSSTGTPTPTIEWFKCNDALKTNPASQGEASTSNTSFDVPTTTVGTYYFFARAHNSAGTVDSDVKTITVVPKAPILTAGGTFTDASKSVTISKADGESGDAVIKYSTDDGANWDTYSEALTITATTTVTAKVVQSGLESAEVSATYTKFVKSELVVVSGGKTWNFNDNVFNTERSITSLTTPAINEEYTFADFAIIKDFSLPSGFDGTTLAYIGSSAASTAYPSRNKGTQAVNLHIKTSIPGKLTVTFSDTGSGVDANAFKRYLNINGTNTEYYTSRPTSGSTKSNDKKTVTTNVIPSGDIWIKAMKEDGETETMICIYEVTFTPTVEAISTADGQTFGTYVTAHDLDFSEASGISAYKITGVEDGVIKTAALTQVPSGTPILIETASAGATVNVPFAASTPGAITENKLKVGADGIVSDGDNYRYVLAAQGGVTGFYKLTSATDVPANRAYLELTEAAAAPSMIRIIDEENSATNVENIESEEKAVKFIENGRILIRKNGIIYDALGRKVR